LQAKGLCLETTIEKIGGDKMKNIKNLIENYSNLNNCVKVEFIDKLGKRVSLEGRDNNHNRFYLTCSVKYLKRLCRENKVKLTIEDYIEL